MKGITATSHFHYRSKMHNEERDAVLEQIASLKQEHRDLDDAISTLENNPSLDELQIRRFKKKKLQLKDQITYLERSLIPDIPA